MKTKCNHDCFNCIYDDCVIETISSEEREAIRERDKQYFTAIKMSRTKKGRVKNKHRMIVLT